MPTERVRFTDLVYSPDGQFFALACEDGTIRLHDCVTNEETTCQDRRICFDDCVTHKEVKRYDWGIGRVGCVAFASDGLTAAAGGANGRVVVWDMDV
jgi:WD40 repeat protein